MRWPLDTNLFIDTAAGIPHASNALLRAAEVEWAGFSAGSRVEALGFPRLSPEEETHLRRLFGQFEEVPVTTKIIDEAIRLRRAVRIKTPAALIAASTLLNGAELLARKADDFRRIGSLKVVDPATL